MSISAKDNLIDALQKNVLSKDEIKKKILSSDGYVELLIDDEFLADEISQRASEYGLDAVEQAVHAIKPDIDINLIDVGRETPLHLLDSSMIGKLVKVKAVVNSMDYSIKPMFKTAFFKCKWCGKSQPVDQTDPFELQFPSSSCDSQRIGASGKPRRCGCIKFDLDLLMSNYMDSRKISIQSLPEDRTTIQVPDMKDVVVIKKSLLYKVRCGDRVTVIGVVKVRPDHKLKVGRYYIEANNIIVRRKEISVESLSEKDVQDIMEFVARPDFYKVLVNNIAPSIHGMEREKEACALALVGGVPKELQDIHWREIINILFVGDPSTAKTQLLTATYRIAPSGMFSSGRGSSAAGLTAAVLKEPHSDVYVISAGVLVLADQGVACIDEIDKMNPEDRSAMHGALEQNIVSINKANIHVDLPAKTTVIAAANPILGQYDSSKTIVENIKMLSIPLLTRFDLIFIVKDIPDRKRDTSIFRHLRDAKKAETIDRDFLKKFIIYAKSLTPEIDDKAFDFMEEYYVNARAHSDSSKVPITPRHRDALIRLSEAHSKLFLKDKVDIEDAKAAVDILNASLEEVGDVDKMAETKGDKKLLIIKFLKDEGPLEESDLKDRALTQMTNEEFVKFIIDLENCGAIVKLSSSPLTYGLPNQKARIDSY